MIPLKLQIKNFLSYGSKLQEINFGNYPLICLSGKNGHGKSALLDAMTWSLWGQARKVSGTTKPDAQLLRLGQTTMLVIFDFAFNGQNYRIRREFALTKKGNTYATLEFGVLDPETESIRPLTEKTIRATQQTIETMLGLDFESFINSAFLRQGQANEFSKKSPKDRKEILASILQLDKYESLRKMALEKSKTALTSITSIKQLQERIHAELTTEQDLLKELAMISGQLSDLQKQETEFHTQTKGIELKKEVLAKEEHQKELVEYQIQQLTLEKNEKEKSLVALYGDWHAINKKRHKFTNSATLEQEKKLATNNIAQFVDLHKKSLELKEKYLYEREKAQELLSVLKEQFLGSVHKKQVELERFNAELIHKKTMLDELEIRKKASYEEYTTTLKEQDLLLSKLTPTQSIHEALHRQEKQFEKRKDYYHKWVAQANVLMVERKNLEQKNELIHDENPSCPLCEQNLSSSRKRFLKNKFTKIEQTITHRLARFSRILKELKELLFAQHKELEQFKKNKEEQKILELRSEQLAQQLNTLKIDQKKNNDTFVDLEKTIRNIESMIKENKKALISQQTMIEKNINENPAYKASILTCKKIETELKELKYNSDEHKKADNHLQRIIQQEKELTDWLHLLSQQEQRKQEIFQLIATLRIMKKKFAQLQLIIKKYEGITQKKEMLEKQFHELQTNHHEIRKKKDNLLEKKGSLEQQQQTLHKRKQELKEYEKQIATLHETIEDYQAVATALSKDGIQALLIEDALPEIEQEANHLLAQLTNNQAHIIIESLRDLKKGGTKETLDIKISDPMGIRPYELFSGGEAFRIDFALRIAISKLLARRAGTSLQTLIIDEGFGSQDEEGLNHLMDAILKIQDDFAKVIIVSHLPAMKDQFPVHFLVQKGAQGSTISVMELG